MHARLFLNILLLTCLPLVVFADAERDADLQAKTADQISDVMRDNGLWVEVTDGVAKLSGKVSSVWAKNEAVARALDVGGVSAVEDNVEIAYGESDEKVAEEVARAVRGYSFFTLYDDVKLSVNEGHVVLTGRVTTSFKSDEIETLASKVMGVQGVTNEIAELPSSNQDQRLRVAIAHRIYGDSVFRSLASMANPPIHIIVERGHVALEGAVLSEIEKRKAEHIVRSTFGVFSVENRLRVGD